MARYISTVIMGRNGPYYPVVDTATGKWVRVEGCQLCAEHKAKEMNDNWSPCHTCAFSDCDKDSDVCMDCDDRGYKCESR